MAEVNDEDLERLANRLAMVASGDGEAENAGRAMGQLARRLGLTGGQLKAMFLAGAARAPRAAAEDSERAVQDIATLRQALAMMEGNWRQAERERDALAAENTALRAAMFRAGTGAQVGRVIGLIVLLAVAAGGAIVWLVPGNRPAVPVAASAPGAPAQGPGGPRMGVVRAAHAMVYLHPDRSAPLVAVLPEGRTVMVDRTVWNMLMQWREVEVAGGTGYVVSTDIDLP
ncbi:MAG: hypothetical protein KGL55_10920 [Rhodospirillales bacterium]|nr:hypothetical protein [Rhodospirillales bacterium]